jgi:hypothetical protein
MQFYWLASGQGRALAWLPFVFLFREQRWVPADSTFLRPPQAAGAHQVGEWNQGCINCHTTHGRSRFLFAPDAPFTQDAIRDIDTHVAEFGIACEACHGPSQQHNRRNQNPLRRYALRLGLAKEQVAVHPLKLSASAGAQVCGQCHSVSLPQSAAHLRTVLADGFAYRPGEDLLDPAGDRVVVQTDRQHPAVENRLTVDPGYLDSLFWPDGMIRVTGREYNGLLRWPCYQHQDEEKGIMTCMSCHEMHPDTVDTELRGSWADDQLRAGMRGDQACVQCHRQYNDTATLVAHTHHLPESSGSRCYNCHMPHTTYGLLKGIRSHTVSSPSVDESLHAGRPNACNLCHLDQTLRWTAQHLERRHGLPAPDLSDDQQDIAAGVLWVLKGDAGVRALLAWHMGWAPAMEAAGSNWMPPYLGVLLGDTYDAVRYVAHLSLGKHAGYETYAYDFLNARDRRQAMTDVTRIWKDRAPSRPTATDRLLIRPDTDFDRSTFLRLLSERDNRPVLLNE